MAETLFKIKKSIIQGTMTVEGAKNAVLVIMASLILTSGKSRLQGVPASDDVWKMIELLRSLGAEIDFDQVAQVMLIDTSALSQWTVSPDIMNKMRASILVMGPLLVRFGRAHIALPGGCLIGPRPIDYHLKAFARMGAEIEQVGDYIHAKSPVLTAQRFVLEYPSVGATENIMMAATLTPGITRIVNAALEPEVFDLIAILNKMGAKIVVEAPATIAIEGVASLSPVEHTIIADRLEAGTLLLAAAVTGGTLTIPNIQPTLLDVFLEKLSDMGHDISVGAEMGITIKPTSTPKAVSFKTMPYPGFPTDLQAPMTAALCLASGTSVVHETVFDNRLLHARELQKMGAQFSVTGTVGTIIGVEKLYGTQVIATDIRASAGLVIAGLAAEGETVMTGIHHIRRGYQDIEKKLISLGADIVVQGTGPDTLHLAPTSVSSTIVKELQS